jgi:hypothetical protein
VTLLDKIAFVLLLGASVATFVWIVLHVWFGVV